MGVHFAKTYVRPGYCLVIMEVGMLYIWMPLASLGACFMTENAEGWLGKGSDGHILTFSNLTRL